ncbi:hypothetical protein B0J12DRAFT_185324 [Macrophomina phaseolina]|uniref:Uncharacterized protein n=1 Tax=Macrophomina phaseolina TaxID=35725 RepID=A0ABQ8G4V9_9PEZI|nr:hypothetical protein B0J12DRAFT_185324 [Macrophomina phaseolina]
MGGASRIWADDLSLSAKALFAKRPADFSLCEETALTIFPGIVFFLTVCCQLTCPAERKRRSCGPYAVTKLPLHLFQALLHIAFCIWLADLTVPETAALVATACGSCISALTRAALSLWCHGFAQQPCSILICYLVLSALTGATRERTLWLLRAYFGTLLPALLTTTVIIEFVLVVVEAKSLRKGTNKSTEIASPQELSNMFSQRLFHWLGPLMVRGYRAKLMLDDMFPWISS